MSLVSFVREYVMSLSLTLSLSLPKPHAPQAAVAIIRVMIVHASRIDFVLYNFDFYICNSIKVDVAHHASCSLIL